MNPDDPGIRRPCDCTDECMNPPQPEPDDPHPRGYWAVGVFVAVFGVGILTILALSAVR